MQHQEPLSRYSKIFEMLPLILAAFAISSCTGFVLELSPSFVDTLFTENVTLRCHSGGYTDIDGSFRSIRILKEDIAANWSMVAELEDNKADIVATDHNIITWGHIGSQLDTYLTVTWPVATADTLGKYRCDVIGFKHNQDFVWEKSEEVLISERNATVQEVYTLVKETNVEMKKEFLALSGRIDNIEKSLNNETKTPGELTEINNKLDQTQALLGNLTNSLFQLSTLVESMDEQLQSMMGSEIMQFWPSGSFGLLAPNSGCPISSKDVMWSTGYCRHHTESTESNHDQVSPYSHLFQPVLGRNNTQNFMYQHFCMRINSTATSLWPRGSYCINRYNACPPGFSSGSVTWDEEDATTGSLSSGDVPTGNYYLTGSDIYYCCRDDGSPNTPVYLPRVKPFYLYRYGGTCQKVAGMKVSEEFMLFDTENTNNGDKYSNTYHPDGFAHNDVRIDLCYYFPY